MKKIIQKIMLGAVILETVLICVFILIGNFSSISWRLLESVVIMFTYLIPCLFYSKAYDNKKNKYIAIPGVSLAGVLALVSILKIWNIIPEIDILSKLVNSFNVIVLLFAIISLMLLLVSKNALLTLLKKSSIILMILLSIFLIDIIWAETYPKGLLLRLYYILIILNIGSFIGIIILKKIDKTDISKTDVNNV